MALKKRTDKGFVTAPRKRKKPIETPSVQNAYPQVLGGRPLMQLEVLHEFATAFVAKPHKLNPAGMAVKPSNLAKVRAKLKERKARSG
jgi:hypothetical protein